MLDIISVLLYNKFLLVDLKLLRFEPEERMFRYTRLDVDIDASYTFRNNTYECEILDISMEGVRIRSRQILDTGDLLKVTLILDGKTVVFFSIIKNKNERESSYGLKIEELHPESRQILDDFLVHRFKTHGTKPYEEFDV